MLLVTSISHVLVSIMKFVVHQFSESYMLALSVLLFMDERESLFHGGVAYGDILHAVAIVSSTACLTGISFRAPSFQIK